MNKPTVAKERLEKIASWPELYGDSANVMIPALEAKQMAEALLVVMEAQSKPAGFYTEVSGKKGVVWHHGAPTDDTAVYIAPPAPAVPRELLDAMDEVIRISDRDHEAWHRAKSAISAYRAAMLNHSEGVLGIVLDERAAFDAWNNEDNLPIAGIPAKNAAWLGWQARAALQLSGNSEQVEPVSHGYTLPAGFCDAGLTRFDLSALQKMPESEWFSWKDDRLKRVNRPHYRCFRLLKAGFLESRVTNPEAPYQSVEFRKIEAQTTPAAPDEIDRFVDQVCGDKPADHQQ